MEDLDAVEAYLGGHLDVLLDIAQVLVAELPEGVRRDDDWIGTRMGLRGFVGRDGNAGQGGGRGRQETAAAGCHDASSWIIGMIARHGMRIKATPDEQGPECGHLQAWTGR